MSKTPPKVFANIEKNRLYITLIGRLDKKQLDSLYTDIRFCVADLKPGFDVVNDLSKCTIASLRGLPTFRRITNYLLTNKVGRIVRVVGADKLTLRQLLNFTSRITGYKADLFYNLEEAETALSNPERRDSLRFILYEQEVEFSFGSVKGKGTISNISCGGCAIQTEEEVPDSKEQILIITSFAHQDNMLNALSQQAEVVWRDKATFGVQFVDMNNEIKTQLWERLVYESNRDLA